MEKVNGVDKKYYYKKYYQANKHRYISHYKKKKFLAELDKKHPNRVEKRKQYWYQCLSPKFEPPKVPLSIKWASENRILTLSFD